MSILKAALALKVLRETPTEKVAAKDGGIISGLGQATKGALRLGKDVSSAAIGGARRGSEILTAAGHPLLGTVLKYTPHAAGLYLGSKALDSGPVQSLKQRYQMYKYRKAVEEAQRQQGY